MNQNKNSAFDWNIRRLGDYEISIKNSHVRAVRPQSKQTQLKKLKKTY